ncbi:MAG: hypothetical protein Lm2023SU_34700 [Serratia ureilytica]
MKPNEYKEKISAINKCLNFIIDNLSKKSINDTDFLPSIEYEKIATRAKKIISGINKHDPINFPNDYSSMEAARFEKNITRLYETTDSIMYGISTDNEMDALSMLIDRVIPIYRIATSFELESKIEDKISLFSKDMVEKAKFLSELVHKTEVNLSRVSALSEETQTTLDDTKLFTENLKNELKISTKQSNNITSLLMKSEAAYSTIDNIKNTLNTASTSLKTLQDKNDIIAESFDEYITSSERKINELLDKEQRISSIEDDLKTHIDHSKELISSARVAMSLTGTFRLSRSFKNAYMISKKTRDRWAVASSVLAIVSLSFVSFMLYEMYTFDYSTLLNSTTPAIMMFAARFSMLPVVLGFFAFCAMQYVKQNNICEDYAHKKLLSETLISFKDELSTSDNEKTYNFLSEILKIVLRSPINTVDKKTHKIEIDHINSIVSQTNEIGKTLLEKLTPKETPPSVKNQ